jgi:YidC/Oxa1 family membrane protein insertase
VFALTFVLILVLEPLLMKKFAPPQQQPPTTEQPSQQQNQPANTSPASPATNPPQATPKIQQTTATREGQSEAETVVENDLYRIVFTNRGAQVKSWVLKKFTDDKNQPLELVNADAAAKYGYPLSFYVYDEALRTRLNSALYVTSGTGTIHAPADLTFEYADGDVTVKKTFHFNNSYVVGIETSVVSKGAEVPAFSAWPVGAGDQSSPGYFTASHVVSYDGTTNWHGGEEVQRLVAKKINNGATIKGPLIWAGTEDQYFAAVFMPEDPESAALVPSHNPVEVAKKQQEVLGAAVGNMKGATSQRLFVGPKSLDVVESVHATARSGSPSDLGGLVNFGFFGVISRPLFVWLRWSQQFIHNWGWAIVVQTLIINLALLPLRLASMKSSLKMQKVAPQIKAIQEKYKKYKINDPRRAEMNQEVAALYKREGVNPVGGCLPLVVQMPFLFAYYSMLGSAIELRHAHWFWVHDLSSADPTYMLPILIIISTLLMQRMTPTVGMDQTQQKMMTYMMPLMLGVISWHLAAGLCLYWSMSNGIGIAQQMIMNRTELGREMRAEMEKRARKKKKD